MHLGVVGLANANAYYRAIYPLREMERRGHEVVWPLDWSGTPAPTHFAGCDVVHVYRRADDEARALVAGLTRSGIPITYDNDDDFTATPKQSPAYKDTGGLRGQAYFSATTKMARVAQTFTTTSDVLAEKYRSAGVEEIEVIANALASDVSRPTNRHRGVVVGWIAAAEHQADLARIGIVDALERLVARHADVRVECIGVDLKLRERYRHDPDVDFEELPRRIAGFDIGIAPLANIPWNRSRSDIKLKEYAASGVPWLASPVGPYARLGEGEGGRLVPDDGWFEALDRLVSNRRERKRLARKARKWAKGQTIDAVADRWEAVFVDAASSGMRGGSPS